MSCRGQSTMTFLLSGWCGILPPLPIKFEIFETFPTAQQMYWSSCHSWPAETNLYNIEIYLFPRITHSHFFATKWMASVEDDLLDDHCAVNCSLVKGNLKPLCFWLPRMDLLGTLSMAFEISFLLGQYLNSNTVPWHGTWTAFAGFFGKKVVAISV